MFHFFQTIFSKLVEVIATGIITVGIVTVPTATPVSIVPHATSTDIQFEAQALDNSKTEIKESPTKLTENYSTTNQPVQTETTSVPKTESKTFTTPNGAVIDESGNVISGPIKSVSSMTNTDMVAGSRVLTAEEIYSVVSPSVVLISASGGNGSGFVINNGKYTLTNAHVVGNDKSVQIKTQNGDSFTGMVLGKNTTMDLALIFNSDRRPPAAILGSSDSTSLKIGSDVFALGYPLSITVGLNAVTFTKGMLSARQNVNFYPGILLQMDTAINSGNSGGPLVNNKGEVIGINTFGLNEALHAQGIYFAIPIQTAIDLVSSLSQYGQSRYEVYPIGSIQTIKRSVATRIVYNDKLSCSQLGYTENDLALCELYKNYFSDYNWAYVEDLPSY